MSDEETMSMSATEIVAEMREQQDHPMVKEHNRPKEILDETADNQTYKKAKKIILGNEDSVCPLCRYHRGDNAKKRQRNGRKKKKYKTVNK
jgi:hypothetical protein